MSHYAPVFEEIVDSSIWCESDLVVKVFLTLLAKKRRDGVVYGSAFNIAQWAKKTEAEVLEALKVLQSPDTRRLEPQPFDGRRVEKVDGGWLILNAGKYQQRMMEVNKQNQNAQAQARFRERGKANGGQQANCSTGNNVAPATPKKVEEAVIIPEVLNTPAFLDVWKMWLEHLKQKKKPPTTHARTLQLRNLAEWGLDRAIAAIENSIAGGWQGIFEPNTGQQQKKDDPHDRSKLTIADYQ